MSQEAAEFNQARMEIQIEALGEKLTGLLMLRKELLLKDLNRQHEGIDVYATGSKGHAELQEAARQADVGKVIYISSGGAMYGKVEYLPMDEDHPAKPVSPYALSKHTGERYVQLYGEVHGQRWTSLRYANVYGPRQDPLGEAGVVAIFCQNLLDGVAPEIHWDGEQTRDFLHVDDCARANLLALEGGDGQAYNVGTGAGTSINALFHTLISHCAKQEDFLNSRMALVDSVFRILLANGNRPMTPEELGDRMNRPASTILRTLSGIRVYKGIRPVLEE